MWMWQMCSLTEFRNFLELIQQQKVISWCQWKIETEAFSSLAPKSDGKVKKEIWDLGNGPHKEYNIHCQADLKHDSFSVRACQNKNMKYLPENSIEMGVLVEFCNNCSSQYKGRGPFAEMVRILSE